LAQLRNTLGRHGTGEEAGLPLDVLCLALSGALALSLLELCLEICGFGELLVGDSFRDVVPEAAALVRELVFRRRTDLGRREERCQVDEQHAVFLVGLLEVLGAVRKPDLVLPVAVDAAQDILVGNVLDAADVVLLHVALVDDTLDLVLCLAEVSFFYVVQDDLDAGLLACHETGVGDSDVEVTTQEAAKVGGGVSEAVGLIIVAVQADVDALVVLTRNDTDRGTCELGRELIKAHRRNTLVGTVHKVCAHRRVVGSLLSKVGNLDLLVLGCGALRSCRSLLKVRLVLCASQARHVILDLPIAAEELSERAVIRLAGLALDILQIFGEPESQTPQHTSVTPMKRLRMERKVLSFEESSGVLPSLARSLGSSLYGAGVPVRELAVEAGVEWAGVEGALMAAEWGMSIWRYACGPVVRQR
jgi:hypothetical protein